MKITYYALLLLLFSAACKSQDACTVLKKEKIDFGGEAMQTTVQKMRRLEVCGYDSIDSRYISVSVLSVYLLQHVGDEHFSVTYGTVADLIDKAKASPGYAELRHEAIKSMHERAALTVSENSPKQPDYSGLCETPKYAGAYNKYLTAEMRTLPAYFDYEEALACARRQHKKLLVYFTGINCVNCRKMEKSVLIQEPVARMLHNDYVLATLYADGDIGDEKINGAEVARLQETKFNTNSQPTFIIINEKGKELARAQYTNQPEAFLSFLKKGTAAK